MTAISRKAFLIIIIISVLIYLGLVWLGVFIVLLVLIFSISMFCFDLILNQFLRKLAKRIFSILFLLSIAVFVKLVVIDIYRIPSGSMENELYPGDVVAVNKLKYGPRLPQSPFEIPLVNLVFYMNKNARSRIKEIWWDYHRWNGITEIKQGDIFVFNSTWDKNYIMIKRCVGLPGDSLAIKKGEIYTNSTIFFSNETVKEN
ncbi:signal peptidase I [Flavobacterium sp. KACC 22761]|uniref:signal peptidase I n=1 Tax=Flavobacterium sp. KACC 22761 TaxID=3092665 RepID=UPI002A753CA9|nr:signal peptidase I [Flavobacterium sp. KACC 22761]WPO77899.1 signal peptidase I [Flavobacterium sp. KACC 22761]